MVFAVFVFFSIFKEGRVKILNELRKYSKLRVNKSELLQQTGPNNLNEIQDFKNNEINSGRVDKKKLQNLAKKFFKFFCSKQSKFTKKLLSTLFSFQSSSRASNFHQFGDNQNLQEKIFLQNTFEIFLISFQINFQANRFKQIDCYSSIVLDTQTEISIIQIIFEIIEKSQKLLKSEKMSTFLSQLMICANNDFFPSFYYSKIWY